MPTYSTRREVRAQPFARYDETDLQALLAGFDSRMSALCDMYLRLMGEHIADIGTMWPSDVHRLQQIRRMNGNLRAIQRKIARAAGQTEREIGRVFEQVAREDTRMTAKILGVSDEAVRLGGNESLQRILRAQARETAGRMANLSNTTVAAGRYRDAVDAAVSAVQSGVEDYGSAIRRTVRQAGAYGLRVKYESGQTRRLDTAARMNILDGVRHLNQSIMEEVGRQFGADGIEIDAHMLCAEDHLPYQGGQYSNEEFESIQNDLLRPFGEWNCRHSWHPIMLGISSKTYTDDQLREMERYSTEEIEIDGRTKTRYQWSQEMRRTETVIRQQKDTATLARYAGDDELRKRCQGTIVQLNRQYERLADQAGLEPEHFRTYVSGFVDDQPVGASGPRIQTSGLAAANLGSHEGVIAGMVGKADAVVQRVWNKNAADLNVLDAHYQRNACCDGRRGVKFDIDTVAKGNDYSAPYQTVFHEFGHQIDYLSGANGLPISFTYKNNLLSQTAMRESQEHLSRWFRDNFNRYYPSLSRSDILKAGAYGRSIRSLADNFGSGKINVDQVLQNPIVFDTLKSLAGKAMEQDFCDSVKRRYNERERADISDIFEPSTKINFPFGPGHRSNKPDYWYITGHHGAEIFAEIYSAEISNHSSLNTIKEFYPETYKVFREILEVIK